MKLTFIFQAAAILIANLFVARATVVVPEILGDHMVLQQQSECLIWGRATKPGERITVTASWGETLQTTADALGRWKVILHTPKAVPLKEGLKTYHIEIVNPHENQIQLRDVLVGEVWLCSGQSNMVMPCGPGYPRGWSAWYGEAAWKEDRAKANRPGLRLFNVQQNVAAEPQFDCKGVIPGLMILPPGPDGIVPPPAQGWALCTPEVADGFSAVAYHLGVTLQEKLDVPVGLVVSAFGGTSISPWISLDGQAEFNGGKPPQGEPDVSKPGALYNGMIAPVMPLRFAGVARYQGASDVGKPGELYAKLLRALIADWRKSNGNPELPFYYVQIASFTNKNPWAELRDGQASVQDDPKVGMVVISDVSDPRNIHPKYKKEIGARLARLALARDYHCTDVQAEFPRAMEAKAVAGKVRVTFAHGEGLRTRNGSSPTCLEVAGSDGVFHPAEGMIMQEDLVVSCFAVPKPATIRLGWGAADMPNLVNASGLPVGQFRLAVQP
jgi:sialate O-acetylesterase